MEPDADETPWCWPRDDGTWELAVPTAERTTLVELCRAGSTILHDDTTIEVSTGAGQIEHWSGSRLSELVDNAASLLSSYLEDRSADDCSPDRSLDDDGLESLTHAAHTFVVVLDACLGHAERLADTDRDPHLQWAHAAVRLAREARDAVMRRFRPRRDGTFLVALPDVEREMIDRGFSELVAALGSGDPALSRLFPTAYPDDDERQAGWAALVHDELITRRTEAIGIARALLERRTIAEDELLTLMRCLNDLRLVLGTRLDVGEDGSAGVDLDDAEHAAHVFYDYLGYLVSDIVRAMR